MIKQYRNSSNKIIVQTRRVDENSAAQIQRQAHKRYEQNTNETKTGKYTDKRYEYKLI
jgi:hypothetical protein